MKIEKIHVKNFKALEEQQLDLKGCSAIITGGNNKGKSSLLSGLIDRFRGLKPNMILRQGEDKGFSYVELTDGSTVSWTFTSKGEKFSYTSKDGLVTSQGVLKALGGKYFGTEFDIDKFINSTPKAKLKQFQELVGIDFTELDAEYTKHYDHRTYLNRQIKELGTVEHIDNIDAQIEEIETEIANQKESYSFDLSEAEKNREKEIEKIEKQNEEIRASIATKAKIENLITLAKEMPESISKYIEIEKIEAYNKLFKIAEIKSIDGVSEMFPLPDIFDVSELESKLIELRGLKARIDKLNSLKAQVEKTEIKIKSVIENKEELIAQSDFPTGFSFVDNELYYNDYPIDDNQLSTSAKYIAGLKLGFLSLGKIKTLHFDASPLDKESLAEIQNWANSQDLQLLIERPDFEAGNIKYEIIQDK